MATLSKTFAFASNMEGWVAENASGIAWVNAGNPAGGLTLTVSGRNKTFSGIAARWTGTWEDLGVPANSIVTAISSFNFNYRTTAYTTVTTNQGGQMQIADSGGTVLASLKANAAFYSAVNNTWTSQTTTITYNVASQYQASDTTIQLAFGANMATGANNSAVVTNQLDNFNYTITYTTPTVPSAPTNAPSVTAGAESATGTLPTFPADVTHGRFYRDLTFISEWSFAVSNTGLTGVTDATQSYSITHTWKNTAGESGQSPAATVVPNPAPPSFTLDPVSATQVDVIITARPYAATYIIYRGLAGGGWSLVHTSASVAANATYTWNNTGLTTGTNYGYKVGTRPTTPTTRSSALSAEQTVIPDVPRTTVRPASQSNASWTAISGGAINDNSDATYLTGNNGSGTLQASFDTIAGSLTPNQASDYYIRVRGAVTAGTNNVTVRLLAGGIQMRSTSWATASTNLATYSFGPYSNADLGADSDLSNIQVELVGTNSTTSRVADVWLDIDTSAGGGPIAKSASDTLSASVTDAGTVAITTFNKTASDTLSASVTDTSSLTIPPSPQLLRPTADAVIVGTWTGSYTDVDEVVPDDNDFIASPTSPAANDEFSVLMATPTGIPDVGNVKVRFRYAKSATAGKTINLIVYLRTATDIIATMDLGEVTSDVFQTFEYTLTSGERALITDWSDLRVRFDPTASGGGAGRQVLFSWIELEAPPAVVAEPIVASDTLSASITDTGTIAAVSLTTSDTLSSSVTESVTTTVSRTLTDTLSASVSETTAFATIPITASDTLSATVSETVATTVATTANDTLSASVSDTAVFGAVPVVASDTLSAAVTETVITSRPTPGTDILITVITESSQIAISGLVTQTASDTLSVSAGDTALITAKTLVASDTLQPTVTDVATDVTISGLVTKSAFDNTSLSVSETTATQNNAIVSDTLSVTVTDTGAFPPIPANAPDTLSAAVSEAVIINATLTASDNLNAALTESRTFAPVTVSAADTLTAALTESTAFGMVAVVAADSLNANVSESVLTSITYPGTDSLAVLLTESSQVTVGGQIPISASDTLSASVADIGTFVPVSIVASDTLSAAITESVANKVGVTASEAANVFLSSEPSQNIISGLMLIPAADAPMASVTETTSIDATNVPRTDTLTASVSESVDIQIGGLITKSAFDAIQASVSETSQFATVQVVASDTLIPAVIEDYTFNTTSATAFDTLNVLLTEDTSFGTVTVFTTDVLTAAVTETSLSAVPGLGSDTLAATVTETSNVIASGVTNQVASDTIRASVTETRTTKILRSTTDTLSASVSEARLFGTVAVTANDTLSAAVTDILTFFSTNVAASDTLTTTVAESAVAQRPFPGTDLLNVLLTETSNVVASGDSDKTASDTLYAQVSEGVNLVVPVTSSDTLSIVLTPTLAFDTTRFTRADSLNVSLMDNLTFPTIQVTANDVLIGTLTETSLGYVNYPGVDILSVTLVESASIAVGGGVEKVGADNLSITIAEEAFLNIQFVVTADDTLSIALTEITQTKKKSNRKKDAADWMIGVERIWTGNGWRTRPRRIT